MYVILRTSPGKDGSQEPRSPLEGEGVPAIFIHCMLRKGNNVILRPHLRRLWQRNGSRAAQSCEKNLRTD